MFSGNFGIRSIVLCKCSVKYIDIYFSLEITFMSFSDVTATANKNVRKLEGKDGD